MRPDTAMKIAVITSMVVGLLLPALLAFFALKRLMPQRRWVRYAGGAAGFAAGFYLVFGLMFPDTLRRSSGPPVTVEIVLPDRYHGFVYLFFDSQQAQLRLSNPGVYTLLVPGSGRLRAGQFPGQQVSADNVFFVIHHLDNTPAQVAEGSQTGGGRSKDGDSVVYIRPFIGTKAEFEAAQKTAKDPMAVLEEMRQAAKQPPKPFQPSSLEGIDRIPGK